MTSNTNIFQIDGFLYESISFLDLLIFHFPSEVFSRLSALVCVCVWKGSSSELLVCSAVFLMTYLAALVMTEKMVLVKM